MKLSIVIVNYRSWDYLHICLQSLVNCSLEPQIIVVDNDGSAQEAEHLFPGVIYLPQPENRWFCQGNNIGIVAAESKYVLLLNPDTVVQPGVLEYMVTFLDENPEYQGATVQLRYPNSEIQRTCSRIPTFACLLLNHTPLGWIFKAQRIQLNAYQWYADWSRDSSYDVEVLPGSCLMIRGSHWMLDAQLRLYFPEDDLAQRFRGAKFRFLADLWITHNEKSVTKSWLATQVYFQDMLMYTRKHHGSAAWGVLWTLSRPVLWGMAIKRKLMHLGRGDL